MGLHGMVRKGVQAYGWKATSQEASQKTLFPKISRGVLSTIRGQFLACL
jgi:hypothetical protein